MASGVPIVWSAREKPIVEAAIRALLAGGYDTPASAGRAWSVSESARALRAGPAGSPEPLA